MDFHKLCRRTVSRATAVRDLTATIDELAQGMACGVKDKNEFEDTVNGIWKPMFQTLRKPMDINQNELARASCA